MVKRKQGRPPKTANSDTTQKLTEKLAMQYQYDNYNKSACAKLNLKLQEEIYLL